MEPRGAASSSTESRPGVLARVAMGLLDVFSSVWTGVILLSLLFFYCFAGSAGVPVHPNILRPDAWYSLREARLFELSEFAWFHWWPFDVLIALICITLTVTTVRRIRLNVVNLGVWMIHAGIIILAIGSVWYFSTKLEGDTPVARRHVVAQLPGVAEPVSFVAAPGNRIEAGGYRLVVGQTTPEWELLSGDDEGELTYKVSVGVTRPDGFSFIRELLAGYPQYTEDLIRSDDPSQPFQRAKKTLGQALVDDAVDLRLDYAPQQDFYLMQTAALYVRLVDRAAATPAKWVERPIHNLPRFNDYIASREHVWTAPGDPLPPIDPIDVAVPAAHPGDPVPELTFHITEYLRYAGLERRRLPGGALDPAIAIELANAAGNTQEIELLAFDRVRSSVGDGAIEFRWLQEASQIEELRSARPPTLAFHVPELDIELDVPITAMTGGDPHAPFAAVDGTPWSYRIERSDAVPVDGVHRHLLWLELQREGEAPFKRWVFDDPSFTRDLPEDGSMPSHQQEGALDERIETAYRPGQNWRLWVVGGPDDQTLRLLVPELPGQMREETLVLDTPVEIRDGVTLAVTRFEPRSRLETRPAIVPRHRRQPNAGVQSSMIRVSMPDGTVPQSQWLPFHVYPFERTEEVLRRFPYRPTSMRLADGRAIEVLFSRERRPMPAAVVLDSFQIDAHIGGFTGRTSSIRDWNSLVRFDSGEGWTDAMRVHMNSPVAHDGFWFFQAQWDAPDGPRFEGDVSSAGQNFTVLGVGNRNGVMMQLLGCCLSVIGMLYAFYVKPIIKRRRQQRVYEAVAAGHGDAVAGTDAGDAALEPVGVSRSVT